MKKKRSSQRYPRAAKPFALGLGLSVSLVAPSLYAASATWDGPADDSLNTAVNWSTDAVPGADGDVMTFNSASSLGTLTWNATLGPGFGATLGLSIVHQGAGALTLDSSANSVFNLGNIQIDSGAGPFALGNGDGSDGTIQFRTNPGANSFTNNSSNAAILGSGLTFASGGALGRVLTFTGTGDWRVNVNLNSNNNGNNTAVTKSGAGVLTLAAAQTYAGATTVSGGVLDFDGATRTTGVINLAAAGVEVRNGTLTPTALNLTATSGTATVSANLAGNTALNLNTGGGTLALSGNNTHTGNLTLASNVAVQITGGSNTGGGAIAFNSFGTSFTMGAGTGSYVTSGITSNGNSAFRFLNLNGGSLQSNSNVFASGAATSVVFNGGGFRSGNAAGVSIFDADNIVDVAAGGATFDTTIGNITVGANASSANPVAINVAGGGAVSIIGGNTLASRITGNGAISIQDGSTWDLNGSVDNAAASLAFSNGATIRLDLTGVGIDNATALVSLSGAFTESLDGGSYTFDFGGFHFDEVGSYKLVGFSSVGASFAAGDFLAANSTLDAGLDGTFVIGADDLTYSISVIPEPSAFAALAGMGALGFAASRRRRKA